MNLIVEKIPPKPNRADIGPIDTPPQTPNPLPGVSDETFAKLHPDIQKNCKYVAKILLKHMKTPIWEESSDQIAVKCNFHHTFFTTIKKINTQNIRCPTCKTNIVNISKDIYEKKQIDPNTFKIIRINRYGQLSLTCVKKGHKLRVTYYTPSTLEETPIKNDLPDYCFECVVDSTALGEQHIIKPPTLNLSDSEDSDDMSTAQKLQALNIKRHFGQELSSDESEFADSDMNEFTDFDAYLKEKADELEREYSNPDFDLDDTFNTNLHSTSTLGKHHQGCCSDNDNEFENYFENSPNNDIIASTIDMLIKRNQSEYNSCKLKAQSQYR